MSNDLQRVIFVAQDGVVTFAGHILGQKKSEKP